jgi:hypothetical protein
VGPADRLTWTNTKLTVYFIFISIIFLNIQTLLL